MEEHGKMKFTPNLENNKDMMELSSQRQQQQCLAQIEGEQLLAKKFPLLSKRKEPISSLSEATKDMNSLIRIDRSLGNGVSLKWIKAQLLDLFRICGAGSVVSDYQIVIIARRIRKVYFYFSLSELTYFFESFIGGCYGTLFVGKTINPQNLMIALRNFDNARTNYFTESQQEQEETNEKTSKADKGMIDEICKRIKRTLARDI